MINELFQCFNFRKPIIFEDKEEGHEVIALPEKTTIYGDKESFDHDLAELLSMAKMAETDNLLTTFFFQPNYTEEEGKYMRMFHQLCQPLQDAWVWRTMRRYAPAVYDKEIIELMDMYDRVILKAGNGILDIANSDIRRQVLGLWAITYENPDNNVELKLIAGENKELWERYIEAIKTFIRMEPDVKHFIELASITEAPYSVRIVINGKGFRYYEVKEVIEIEFQRSDIRMDLI